MKWIQGKEEEMEREDWLQVSGEGGIKARRKMQDARCKMDREREKGR